MPKATPITKAIQAPSQTTGSANRPYLRTGSLPHPSLNQRTMFCNGVYGFADFYVKQGTEAQEVAGPGAFASPKARRRPNTNFTLPEWASRGGHESHDLRTCDGPCRLGWRQNGRWCRDSCSRYPGRRRGSPRRPSGLASGDHKSLNRRNRRNAWAERHLRAGLSPEAAHRCGDGWRR